MTETIHYRFKVRGASAATLTSVNETPLVRELVIETDTGKIKLGDGATAWNDLPYLPGGEGGVSLAEVVVDATTAYTVLDAHSNVYRRLTNAAAKTITVGPQSGEALADDYEQHFDNDGAGAATFVAGSGVTIKAPAGGTLVVPEGGVATLKRVALNVFRLLGTTVPAGAVAAAAVTYDNAASGLSAIDAQGAIDELASASGPDLDIITEASAFTAVPATHKGRQRLIFAGGDVTFSNAQPYAAGHVFNICATTDLELLVSGVTLSPPALGTSELTAGMTVTVAMTGATSGQIFGQTVAAP